MKVASIESAQSAQFTWQHSKPTSANLAETKMSTTTAENRRPDQSKHNRKPAEVRAPPDRRSSTSNKQQTPSEHQDGKRALIKNQLHLIEQLQLENANLRNERDQLQLENEELKFQLQMISSSNILAQSGNALADERQLEKYVGGADNFKSSLNENFHSSSGNTQLSDTQTTTTPAATITTTTSQHRAFMSGGCCDSEASLGATNLRCTNTPLRYPVRSLNLKLGEKSQVGIIESSCHSQQQETPPSANQVGYLFKRTNAFYAPYISGVINSGGAQQQGGFDGATANGKFLNAKSSSLSSFDIKQNLSNLITPMLYSGMVGADLGHDDEDQRIKLVEQSYGGDSGRVQAAALIIQRAFRKYQICKRFRMITEQLRHCQQQQSTTSRISTSNSTAPTTNTSDSIGSNSKTNDFANNNLEQQSDNANSIRLSRNKLVRDSLLRNQYHQLHHNHHHHNQQQQQKQQEHDNNRMFLSGATRTAAWESLSYAASRLAASAANSLSNNINNNNSNNSNANSNTTKKIIKSSSNANVNAESTNQKFPISPMSNYNTNQVTPLVSKVQQQQQQNKQQELEHRSSSATLKSSNPVVAAAINFQQLESMRKRQYRVGLNIFNKHPEKGISFLIAHSFIASSSPCTKAAPSYYLSNQLHFIDGNKQNLAHQTTAAMQQTCQACCEEDNLKCNVAHFLLSRKGLAKEKIGQYLGNLQSGFNQDVLKFYLQALDFQGLQIDVALRKFSATLRLPGEAQKIEKMVDCFAQRYVQCQQQQPISRKNASMIQLNVNTNVASNATQPSPTIGNLFKLGQQKSQHQNLSNYKNNLTLLTRDEIFILTFAIIMLNTDLHSPSLKTTSRMSAMQFVNNLRGVFKSQNINENDLIEIYERVKADQIATTPDHLTHVMKVQQSLTIANNQKKELPNLCVPHRRLVCSCRLFEVYDINKKERVGQHQREVFLFNDMLLITKLARRARANSAQQFAFRQSIPLKGLQVELFQSAHYNHGIRIYNPNRDGTIIMFNAHNDLDQSRFVEDLSESIAETNEMDLIRSQNIIETIHLKHLERLKQHALQHTEFKNSDNQITDQHMNISNISNSKICEDSNKQNMILRENISVTGTEHSEEYKEQRYQMKCLSMSDSCLSTVVENKDESLVPEKTQGLLQEESMLQPSGAANESSSRSSTSNQSSGRNELFRRCSASSIHSLDSGMFISRDVSPNQSS